MARSTISTVDVSLSHHGNVILFHPETQAARAWVNENVEHEGWQWFGRSAARRS